MCIVCYNTKLRKINPEYKKACSDCANRYRKNNPEKAKEYNKRFTSKAISTGEYIDCPICGLYGQVRVNHKFNNVNNTNSDYCIYVQHYPKHNNSEFKTCYVSLKNFPEFKHYIDEVK